MDWDKKENVNLNLSSLRHSSSDQLARLIEAREPESPLWTPEELRSIARHQWNAPVHFDLTRYLEFLDGGVDDLSVAGDLTFGEALKSSSTPEGLLGMIKDFAKLHWHGDESGLPKELCMLLYYGAIGAALRQERRITNLSDEAVTSGLNWVANQNWAPEEAKRIASAAVTAMQNRTP